MKKPKLVFIHPTIGETTGGSQVFVLELAERLKDKCEITILSAKKVNELCWPIFSISRGAVSKYNSKIYHFIRNFLKKYCSTPDVVIEHLSSFFPVLHHLLTNKYDVIFPNNDWGGLMVAATARKILKTPILFAEHSGFMEKGKIAARNLSFKPDKYIALSEDFKFWVKKCFPDCNVEYIPNGVDLQKFNPEIIPKALDLPRPIILTASRNQPNKRLELAIEAVAKLNKASLLILTSGNDIETLNQKGKALIGEERFRMISAPYNEMASYYRSCDIFTLPSVYEPFGLVYLEAMACNKPVVAPDDMSRIDIIGKAGILCDPTNMEAYVNALDKALNMDFGDIPFRQAQKYSWNIVAERYYEVVSDLIKS